MKITKKSDTLSQVADRSMERANEPFIRKHHTRIRLQRGTEATAKKVVEEKNKNKPSVYLTVLSPVRRVAAWPGMLRRRANRQAT